MSQLAADLNVQFTPELIEMCQTDTAKASDVLIGQAMSNGMKEEQIEKVMDRY